MKRQKQLRWYVVLLIFAAAVAVVITTSYASGNCNGPGDDECYNEIVDVDVATGDVIGGDTLIDTGGNKSLAVVAPGLGDVDIAQCLGSTSWSLLVGAKQKLVLNHVCMAEFYLKQGRYALAAQSLCNQPEILAEYSTEDACELEHDFQPGGAGNEELTETFEDLEEQHDEDLQKVQMTQSSIVDRLDALSAQLEAPRPQPRPVIVQQEAPEQYTAEDRAYILSLYTKGEDEDE